MQLKRIARNYADLNRHNIILISAKYHSSKNNEKYELMSVI